MNYSKCAGTIPFDSLLVNDIIMTCLMYLPPHYLESMYNHYLESMYHYLESMYNRAGTFRIVNVFNPPHYESM